MKSTFENARANMDDYQRRKADRESSRSIDFENDTNIIEAKEENIYSEPIFDDDCTDEEIITEVKTPIPQSNPNPTGRIAVLDNIPPNYVLFAPKAGLACGEGIISCTLVPRELVGNMVTVSHKGRDQEDSGSTPGQDLHMKTNIEYLRNYGSCFNEEKKGIHDKGKDDEDDGYSEPEEEDELEKMQYNHALLNLISETSLEIKKCHDHMIFNTPSKERRQKPKRSSSKVSSFLGNIFGGPQHSRKQRYPDRMTSRHNIEGSDTQDDDDKPGLMDRQLKHNISIIGV